MDFGFFRNRGEIVVGEHEDGNPSGNISHSCSISTSTARSWGYMIDRLDFLNVSFDVF